MVETIPTGNDGSTFRNREGRLPSKPNGYYTEYVHPTPGIGGPGPQRVVSGGGGEMYFTPDHYNTFIPIRLSHMSLQTSHLHLRSLSAQDEVSDQDFVAAIPRGIHKQGGITVLHS